jgi:hypothetical protein
MGACLHPSKRPGVGLDEVTVFFAPGGGGFHGEIISSVSRRVAHAMARAWRTQMRDRDEAGPTFAQLFFSRLPEEQARSQLALTVTALLRRRSSASTSTPPR